MIESNRVEFKKELNDSLEKEVVGFLNYSEGREIYIGIADDGAVLGVENSDDIQKRIVDRKVYDKSIFKFSPNFLKVSFPTENVREKIKLNNTQKSIIDLIKQDKYITQEESL